MQEKLENYGASQILKLWDEITGRICFLVATYFEYLRLYCELFCPSRSKYQKANLTFQRLVLGSVE